MGKTNIKKKYIGSTTDIKIIEANKDSMIEMLAAARLTNKEIAKAFGISENSVQRFKAKNLAAIRAAAPEKEKFVEMEKIIGKPIISIEKRETFWKKDAPATPEPVASPATENKQKAKAFLLTLKGGKTNCAKLQRAIIEKLLADEVINQSEICRQLDIKGGQISYAIKKLQEAGITIPSDKKLVTMPPVCKTEAKEFTELYLEDCRTNGKRPNYKECTELGGNSYWFYKLSAQPAPEPAPTIPAPSVQPAPAPVAIKTAEDNKGKIISCSLFENRHEVPINITMSIFGHALPAEKMHDYAYQESCVAQFIKEHVPSHSTIRCFTSGCVMANAALIATCIKNQTNLVLMHYDLNSSSYRAQVVLDQFDGPISTPEDTLREYFSRVYPNGFELNVDIKDINTTQFIIREVFQGPKSPTNRYKNVYSVKIWVTDDESVAVNTYMKVNKIIFSDENYESKAYQMMGHRYRFVDGKWEQGFCFGIVRNYTEGG